MQPHTDGRAQQLEDAFQLFTQMSSQLEDSYRVLEARVAQLSEELAAARSERLTQLAETERLVNRLERLLDLLPGGVLVLDGDGTISACNPAALDLLGPPLEGMGWRQVVERAFQTQVGDDGEVGLLSGRKVSLSARSLEPEPGQIMLLMDVTEQHALQTTLNRHRRLSAMGEMAAALAHQVRTPLASALLYVSHLGRHDLADADRRRFTDKVVGRLRHLEHLVGDMLQFARGGSFDMDDVPVDALVADLQQTLDPQLEALGGEFELFNRAPGALLRGNREALQSALLNLATNALQACPVAPKLRIEVRSNADQQIVFLLSDNGPGIAEDIRERLFAPFFTTRADGTGLGLAVVRAIALAHQGEVWLHSSSVHGSTFAVRVPCARNADVLPGDFAPRMHESNLTSAASAKHHS